MAASSGISQLLKGVIIGVVLILAILGALSIFDNKPDSSNSSKNLPSSTNNNIDAPEIRITTPTSTQDQDSQKLGSTESNQTIETLDDTDKELIADNNNEKQTLELERNQYGMLSLSSINPDNQNQLIADYEIYNKDGVKVAESKRSENTSYRLPTGKYKVISTLVQQESTLGRIPTVISKTQLINVSANETTDYKFQLQPPPTIGVLQVSAKINNQAIRANFIIQNEKGETVASRNNVTNSLFKLKAGSYRVSVRSGATTDFRTVVVDGGESTEEIFTLKESFQQGRVLVRVFDTKSSTPVYADIEISDARGKAVQSLRSVNKTELSLAAGNYTVKVTAPNEQSTKRINVIAGQVVNEIFRFTAPIQTNDSQVSNNNKPEVSNDKNLETIQTDPNAKGTLRLIALNEKDRKALKSNFYVQTLAGKHLNKSIYKDSTEFSLAPGTYKITVRSKNRKNQVKNIQVIANQTISETFIMRSSLTNSQTNSNTVTLAPPKPARDPAQIPNGFLSVRMLSNANRPVKKGELNTHFIVKTLSGRKIVELTSVSSGNFKLDTGEYIVSAIHNKNRQDKRVTIRQNQNSQIIFNSESFKLPKGILQSRIIDSSGRPLRGNLSVTNLQGKIVASANNASMAKFELPPREYRINVDFRGLQGSENIRIRSGETTAQTFTIASDRSLESNQPTSKNKPDIRKILEEKAKEELRRLF